MTTKTIQKSSGYVVLLAALLWAITFIGVLLLIKEVNLSQNVKIVLAFVPLLPFIFFLFASARVNTVDELYAHVQLRAIAIAFFLTLLMLMTLGLLELALPLSKEDFSLRHIWQYCILFYFIGLAITWRRYKV